MVMQTGVQKAERTAIKPNYYTGATLAVKQPGKMSVGLWVQAAHTVRVCDGLHSKNRSSKPVRQL
jgi:hypothetical protein